MSCADHKGLWSMQLLGYQCGSVSREKRISAPALAYSYCKLLKPFLKLFFHFLVVWLTFWCLGVFLNLFWEFWQFFKENAVNVSPCRDSFDSYQKVFRKILISKPKVKILLKLFVTFFFQTSAMWIFCYSTHYLNRLACFLPSLHACFLATGLLTAFELASLLVIAV